MATSPNYGWIQPDDSDFVKDGALAIRDVTDDIDTTVYGIDLKVQGLIHPFLLMGA